MKIVAQGLWTHATIGGIDRVDGTCQIGFWRENVETGEDHVFHYVPFEQANRFINRMLSQHRMQLNFVDLSPSSICNHMQFVHTW